MQKGNFKTETFNQGKPTITMIDWVEPTIYNNGTSIVNVNGMNIKPGTSFRLGPANVKMNGVIHLQFPIAGRHDIKVNYTLLEKPCPS